MEEKDKLKSPANVTSFICGIISVLGMLFYYIGLPLGIVAIIFGAVGTKKTGSKIAKTGLILGIVGTSLTFLVYAIMASIIVLAQY